jgi:hypothetical protein
MAYFAQIDKSFVVIQVIAVSNETIDDLPFPDSEPIGVAFCQSLYGEDTIWKQTSFNATFRKNFAGIGTTYDPVIDAFILIKPYPSWLLNTETCQWQAPVPYPTDGKAYYWDEATQSWVRIKPAA